MSTSANNQPANPNPVAPRTWQDVVDKSKRTDVPEGVWMRCSNCDEMIYRKQLEEENLWVCPSCEHHYRVSALVRANQICDPGSFERKWENIRPDDPLSFQDMKAYKDRIVAEQKKTNQPDAIVAGTGYVKGRRVALACMDPTFMMGSMGSVVGEVLTNTIEHAHERDLPLIVVSCSGGARMQESVLSLMQMAKTSAALARLQDDEGLFISILSDPTTGGVTASFAMLGDVIFAEPNALICFAGPRVIANTVKQDLPDGFQRAEFLLEKGFVDRVVHRHKLRSEISRIIDYAGK